MPDELKVGAPIPQGAQVGQPIPKGATIGEPPKAEPSWWEHIKAILGPQQTPRTDMGAQVDSAPGSFEGHPENVGEYIPASVGEVAGGASDVLHGDVSKGLHRVIGGVGSAAAPALPFVAAGAPAMLARAAAGGLAGSKAASSGAEFLGASPDQAALAGDVGGIVGGGAGAKFPLKSHAGELFAEVSAAAKGLPVDVAKPGNLALEAQELSKQGNSMPKIIRDFLARTTDPDKPPLTYGEARQFSSSASRLSANEASRLSPVMARQINRFRAALNDSISDTAEQAGKLDQYVDAMKEYRSASKIQELAKGVVTKAIPRGVGAYVIYKLLGIKP